MMTKEQRDILSHIVIDPDAWYAHVLNEWGQERADDALAKKVMRWAPIYEVEKIKPQYKTRAERDLDEERVRNERIQSQT